VALASVLMADMSRAAANRKYDEMLDDMTAGLRYVWFACAPLAVYMICLREPLIKLLFMRGNFTVEHVEATTFALLFYAMGIPAFCAMKVILPAFYARKKMTTPLIISLTCIGLNIPLSLILMHPLKQGGIALATVISQMLNNGLLLYMLKRENFSPDYSSVLLTALRSVLFALAGALPLIFYRQVFEYLHKMLSSTGAEAAALLLFSILFVIIFWVLAIVFKMQEPHELYQSIIARQSRKKEL
jgi:putative peptidoglycan lipid II flippase